LSSSRSNNKLPLAIRRRARSLQRAGMVRSVDEQLERHRLAVQRWRAGKRRTPKLKDCAAIESAIGLLRDRAHQSCRMRPRHVQLARCRQTRSIRLGEQARRFQGCILCQKLPNSNVFSAYSLASARSGLTKLLVPFATAASIGKRALLSRSRPLRACSGT
jgi:hypothetical protein